MYIYSVYLQYANNRKKTHHWEWRILCLKACLETIFATFLVALCCIALVALQTFRTKSKRFQCFSNDLSVSLQLFNEALNASKNSRSLIISFSPSSLLIFSYALTSTFTTATFKAFSFMNSPRSIASKRGKKVSDILGTKVNDK